LDDEVGREGRRARQSSASTSIQARPTVVAPAYGPEGALDSRASANVRARIHSRPEDGMSQGAHAQELGAVVGRLVHDPPDERGWTMARVGGRPLHRNPELPFTPLSPTTEVREVLDG